MPDFEPSQDRNASRKSRRSPHSLRERSPNSSRNATPRTSLAPQRGPGSNTTSLNTSNQRDRQRRNADSLASRDRKFSTTNTAPTRPRPRTLADSDDGSPQPPAPNGDQTVITNNDNSQTINYYGDVYENGYLGEPVDSNYWHDYWYDHYDHHGSHHGFTFGLSFYFGWWKPYAYYYGPTFYGYYHHGHHFHHHHGSFWLYYANWSHTVYTACDPWTAWPYAGLTYSSPYPYSYGTYTKYYYTNNVRTSSNWSVPGSGGSSPYQYATINQAWDALLAGDAREARAVFVNELNRLPGDGLPRIGYAFASSMMGDHGAAVYAMRRALRSDPDALRYVPAGDAMDQLLRSIRDYYDNRAKKNFGDADSLFMVASLHYLLGEYPAAQYALDVAASHGDRDQSAENLNALIQEAFAAPQTPAGTPG